MAIHLSMCGKHCVTSKRKIMKKYIYSLFCALVSVAMLTACSADEGTDEGNDSKAKVTLYEYAAAVPYDADCDAYVRVVANSATAEAYALAETAAEKDANVEKLGEAGYADYVVSKGRKLESIKGASAQDVYFQNLPKGDNKITVVAVGKGGKCASEITFSSIEWNDVAKGTYTFAVANVKSAYAGSVKTTLQVSDADPSQYRFKDLFGTGYHMKMVAVSEGTDNDGDYVMVRVHAQSTGLAYKDLGVFSVRDVAEWQNDEQYIDCKLYSDHSGYFWLQYFVSADNIGYDTDEFTPDE